MTKLVTAVAIMQLVEKNLVTLDDDARDYVPELKDIQILRDMNSSGSTMKDYLSVLLIFDPRWQCII